MKITPEQFIKTYIANGYNYADTARSLNTTYGSVTARVARMRKHGVKLRLQPKKYATSYDVDSLNQLISQLKG